MMTSKITVQKINKFVMGKQRLTDEKVDESLVETVRAVGGLHATGPMTPYLSLFARVDNFKQEQLDNELYVKRSLGKIRYVRTTLHVLPKDWIMTALTAVKSITETNSRAYAQFLGITDKQYAETSKVILEVLKVQSGLTVMKIKKELNTTLNISPIVNLMCDQGLLIRGLSEKGRKSNLHTYYPLNEFFLDLESNKKDESEAKTEVIKWYLASFGPVSENDISWWTGFTRSQVKHAIKVLSNELTTFAASDIENQLMMLKEDQKKLDNTKTTGKQTTNLLPALDPYLMAFKDRERYLDLEFYNYIFDRGGNAVATILLDGKVIGVWDLELPFMKVLFFREVKAEITEEVYAKASNMGTFVSGGEVKVVECTSMVPLTERTAGGFMSPLKGSRIK